ncbi:hypothetical protein PInf_028591 [Phytophthora infestans]|nr:hypothetical protein PInf_028591 [Phytophthora infestans]
MLGVEASNGGNQADTAVRMHECGSDDEEIGGTSTTAADGAKVRNVAKARRRRTKQERVQMQKDDRDEGNKAANFVLNWHDDSNNTNVKTASLQQVNVPSYG